MSATKVAWSGLALLGLATTFLLPSCKGSRGSAGASTSPSATLTPTQLQKWETVPGVVMSVTKLTGGTGASGSFNVGDAITVTYTVKKNDGTNWQLAELTGGHVFVSGPSFNYQRVIDDKSDLFSRSRDNHNGTFSYTFANRIPATYDVLPYNRKNTDPVGDGELRGQALLAGTYTVGMYGHWDYSVDGSAFECVGQTTADFLFGGATSIDHREVVKSDNCNRCHTEVQAHNGERRTAELCVLCHTSGAVDASGNLTSIDLRVMVHKMHDGEHLPSVVGVVTKSDGTRDYTATPVPYVLVDGDGVSHDFSAVGFPVWPNLNTPMPRDFGYSALSSTVTPPATLSPRGMEDLMRMGATECSKCHGDPDGSGPLTAPAQGDVHRSQPSRRACGSCHDDVDWTKPYLCNQSTMPPQVDDSKCLLCHAPTGPATGGLPAPTDPAHLHPINDTTLNPGVDFNVTAIAGGTGTGGNFKAGDKPSITFTVKDDAGNDVPLQTLDATSTILVGPTNNYQFVFPFATPNGASSALPVDFSGRLAASSTTNKGSMSKLVGATVTENLVVQFSSATAFTVTGKTSGALGGSALPVSPSTNPSGSSLGTLFLTGAAVPQTITVTFSDPLTFAVVGSVSGAMGGGVMPASVNATRAFTSTDGTVTFILTSGSTAFAAGNAIYAVVFKCNAANPGLFGVVAGRTSFAANDRFYYDTQKDQSSYTFALPMDLPTEYLGNGNGAVGQVLTAANVPVYYGRQTLWEETALVGAATTLVANANARDRYVDVAAIDAGLAIGDYAVLDKGVAGKEEYALVGYVDATLKRVWFRTPLRFAHATGTGTFQEATLTYKQEGVNYTLNPAAGTITSITAFGSGNAIVMSYRTDGAFGWYRGAGDTLQSLYVPVINDSPDLDSSWGEWSGLAYLDGTYSASIWGNKKIVYGAQNEVITYNGIGEASTFNLLYGAATTVQPYSVISSGSNCETCHTMVGPFHGGNRRDFNTCVLCHGVAGNEDWPIYASPNADLPTTGVTINFRTMLHKIHMGEDLANAATYTVLGNSSSHNTYGEVNFPVLPGRTMNCTKCHGTADNWKSPGARQHPSQAKPTREWRAACGACHDSNSAQAHIDAMTPASGLESCETCHGTDGEFAVELMHKVR